MTKKRTDKAEDPLFYFKEEEFKEWTGDLSSWEPFLGEWDTEPPPWGVVIPEDWGNGTPDTFFKDLPYWTTEDQEKADKLFKDLDKWEHSLRR